MGQGALSLVSRGGDGSVSTAWAGSPTKGSSCPLAGIRQGRTAGTAWEARNLQISWGGGVGVWLSQTSVLGPISSIAATPTIQTPANMRAELGRATRCPEAVGAGLRM